MSSSESNPEVTDQDLERLTSPTFRQNEESLRVYSLPQVLTLHLEGESDLDGGEFRIPIEWGYGSTAIVTLTAAPADPSMLMVRVRTSTCTTPSG